MNSVDMKCNGAIDDDSNNRFTVLHQSVHYFHIIISAKSVGWSVNAGNV